MLFKYSIIKLSINAFDRRIMIEINDNTLREAVMDIWLKNPTWGQNEIASQIGVSALTFRKFINKQIDNLKMTTKLKIVSWLNSVVEKQ